MFLEAESRPVRVAVRSRRRIMHSKGAMDLESLKKQKEYLVSRLNEIDQQRNQVKSQLRALHGQQGRTRIVARLKDQDSKLLADRNDTCQQIGDLKKLIRSINQESQPRHEVLASCFMRVAKESLDEETYEDLMQQARERADEQMAREEERDETGEE